MRAFGIDISKYDYDFSPTALIDFVILRASYGTPAKINYTDSLFEKFFIPAQRVPFRGAYHYLSSHISWKSQADYFLKLVSGKNFDFFSCDVETTYNIVNQNFVSMAIEWMKYVQENTGKRVLLYTNPTIYNSYICPFEGRRAAEFPLWIAQYRTKLPNFHIDQPYMPKNRTDWSFWQFLPGEWHLYGYESGVGRNGVDCNVFNGTVEELATWLHYDSVPDNKPPVEPESYTVIVSALNVRSQPYIRNNIVGRLTYGATFPLYDTITDISGNIWGRIGENKFIALFYKGEYFTTWRAKSP